MRRALAAAAAVLLLLTGCAAKEPEVVTPPFWQAVSPEGEQAWLLGSMHAGKKNTAYPDYILEAFDSCGSVICEVDTVALESDSGELTECLSLLLCPDGTTARDWFGGSYDGIKAKLTDEAELGEVAAQYADEYYAEFNREHTARIAISVLEVLGGILGLCCIPAAFEKCRSRLVLIAPAIAAFVCAAAAEIVAVALALGQCYAALPTLVFAPLYLLFCDLCRRICIICFNLRINMLY